MRKYEELTDDLKELARELHPQDYAEWLYQVQGVEIAFSAGNKVKGGAHEKKLERNHQL